jgi:uncharacterized protein (TIGR03437 family)
LSQIAWKMTRAVVVYCAVYCAVSAIPSQAQTFTVVASFTNAVQDPGPMIQGADGNFYGSAATSAYAPVIFKMTPAGALSTIYTFPKLQGGGGVGAGANLLLLGSDGNFYGLGNPAEDSHGAVFKLMSTGTLTTLHAFGGPDGDNPNGLIQDADGNFYGTTNEGGASLTPTSQGLGTVFKMTPDGTLTTLHSFSGPDGSFPSGVIQATDGNLYGTTKNGGTGCPDTEYPIYNGCGTVFKITPSGSFTLLYTLNGTDGYYPTTLIQASDGNFYGVAHAVAAGGQVFKFTPNGTFTTLAELDNFSLFNNPLFQGADGNLYGMTPQAVYQVTPAGTLTTLHFFGSSDSSPSPTSFLQPANGNFYGTTNSGGVGDNGTFFELTLPAPDTPAIASSGGVLNGASFQPGISPDSWITIYGTNLSSATDTWVNAIVKGALPTTLDGVSVMVGDQAAYIEYVSPTQIDAVVPNATAGTAPITVTTAIGTSPAVMVQLSAEQPAFFQWGTYAVATRQNFSLAVKNGTFSGTTTVPAAPGDVIILWGTGFGPTSPTAPAGQETPSNTTYNTANTVSVTVGNKPATVYGAALAPGYAGLYQVAIQIPASLANGDYPVVATISGVQSPSTTLITVQK